MTNLSWQTCAGELKLACVKDTTTVCKHIEKLATRVCQSFTRQIRVYKHEKVGEKVGEERNTFYLLTTVCQHVCQLFVV